MSNSPFLDQIIAALNNSDGENTSNIFVSIHGSDPGEQRNLGYYRFFDDSMLLDEQAVKDSFTAVVPHNTIVVLFSSPNCLAGSRDEDELALMKFLSQPNWVNEPTQALKDAGLFNSQYVPFVNAAFQIASIYFPGDEIYNNLMSFDEQHSYYDIFRLDKRDKPSIHNRVEIRAHGVPQRFVSEIKGKSLQITESAPKRQSSGVR